MTTTTNNNDYNKCDYHDYLSIVIMSLSTGMIIIIISIIISIIITIISLHAPAESRQRLAGLREGVGHLK